MVENPEVQTNLGVLEDNVLRGVCRKEDIRSGKRRGTKAFRRFGTVWGCARWEQTTRTKRGTKNVKSNDRFFGGLPGQHHSDGNADSSDRNTARVISGYLSRLGGHGRKATAGNKAIDRAY